MTILLKGCRIIAIGGRGEAGDRNELPNTEDTEITEIECGFRQPLAYTVYSYSLV